jgi:hypothetical protein
LAGEAGSVHRMARANSRQTGSSPTRRRASSSRSRWRRSRTGSSA